MAKPGTVDDTLAELSALKARRLPPDALVRELGKYLASKHSLVVAGAAALAAASAGVSGESLQTQLIEAFGRFLIKGATTDKGCAAKKEVANALHELDCTSAAAEDVFLTGVRYVQLEPVWGGSEDTAAELRGICACGLVRVRHPDVMNLLAELLTDPSHVTRALAARAVAYAGRDEGAPLLRLRILSGDPEEQVTSECLSALRELSGLKALEFFRRLLADNRHAALHEAVALAIGEMRHADALAVLRARWEADMRQEQRLRLLLPMALSRLPEALDFLVDVVRSKPEALATAALDALGMYREYPAVRDKIAAAVEERGSRAVEEHYRTRFGVERS